VHPVAGQPLGHLRRDHVHRAGAGFGQVAEGGQLVPGDQQGADRVAGLDRPPDYLLALGDEQAVLGLQAPAQVDVGQPDVVREPRIVRVGDRNQAAHLPSLADRARGHRASANRPGPQKTGQVG
jgi:hypothetical protein